MKDMELKRGDIVETSMWVDPGVGYLNVRIVLRFWDSDAGARWVTHKQYRVSDGTHGGFDHGHYFNTIAEAAEDFKERADELYATVSA